MISAFLSPRAHPSDSLAEFRSSMDSRSQLTHSDHVPRWTSVTFITLASHSFISCLQSQQTRSTRSTRPVKMSRRLSANPLPSSRVYLAHHDPIHTIQAVSFHYQHPPASTQSTDPTAAKPATSSLPSSSSPSPHRNDINPRRTPASKRHHFQGAGQKDATPQTLKPRTPSRTSPASTHGNTTTPALRMPPGPPKLPLAPTGKYFI
ncbi:hypothetical protein K456DRAFT_56431 [Colletotrichum gloeosporioides 23]|nr:hypothetical protein K456DRAFT_56431 [Colletotrichum gloeosporioides 23]